ncbi:unnamed protein product [Fraxinus pennsylvanica]|uniref:Peptidase S54 rhomboid domain-containing protein n=1 Tax=Fraxinus pennsylvanica TaxID=56036 RepID=A0AAD1YYL7_9LAMI|nr:unnamed protein product [Fraxinus pennsylvanica]
MKQKALKECENYAAKYAECASGRTMSVVWKCREQANQLNQCLHQYTQESFTALGSWFLFTFGLEVSRKYGSFTFFLIYILGVFSGNLISFLHIPEPTLGGTGPAFALIGAWLIYQVQNRDVIATEASESMFQKAIIFTALSFVLSNFGPIDDWSHFGAAFTGIVYGFFTCTSLQVKDASSDTGQEERMTLVRRYADPCKSLMCFSFFLLLLSSLLLIIEPPLYLL